MPEAESNPPESEPQTPRYVDPALYAALDRKGPLDSLRFYLITIGIVALCFAALCLFLDRTGNRGFFAHKDFSINPNFLGRMLLFVGIIAYAGGRGITYWQRFSQRGK